MLNRLRSPKTIQKDVRRGRGYGSKRGGHTTGRGQKGQKSRTGYSAPRKIFEGAATPIMKRIPKLKGFSREKFVSKYKEIKINLERLNKLQNDAEVTIDNLKVLGLVKSRSKKIKVKLLGNGKLDKKLVIKGLSISESARKAILKAGGKIF